MFFFFFSRERNRVVGKYCITLCSGCRIKDPQPLYDFSRWADDGRRTTSHPCCEITRCFRALRKSVPIEMSRIHSASKSEHRHKIKYYHNNVDNYIRTFCAKGSFGFQRTRPTIASDDGVGRFVLAPRKGPLK